jgi:hypothetical protein
VDRLETIERALADSGAARRRVADGEWGPTVAAGGSHPCVAAGQRRCVDEVARRANTPADQPGPNGRQATRASACEEARGTSGMCLKPDVPLDP